MRFSWLHSGEGSLLILRRVAGYNLELVHEHIKERHPQEGKYQCDECPYATDHDFALEIHSAVHNGSPPFK